MNNSGSGISGGSYSTITNNTCENNNYGIYLGPSSYCTIESNTCENNNCGINLGGSENCTIESNICSYSKEDDGIQLEESLSNRVANNTCAFNDNNGIDLDDSRFNNILGNTCFSNNEAGIELDSSDDNIVINNICNHNMYGIYLQNSTDVTYNDNEFLGNEKDIRIEPEPVEEEDDDGGFLPGFELVVLLLTVLAVAVYSNRKKT